MIRTLARGLVLTTVALAAVTPQAWAASTEVRARAFELAYNLDRDRALALLREAHTGSPDDAALHRGLASLVWLEILFRRGAISVDDLLGAVSRQNLKLPPPEPALAAEFETHVRRAIDLSRARSRANPRDVDALYEAGAAEGLLASYVATVQGRVLDAMGDARRAYNAHERVLELAPTRKDAGLVVGTYRYVVASLALPIRMLAYLVGFGGDKARGLSMIEEAAAYPGDAQPEARFALVALYNREGRFDAALDVLDRLRTSYPRNRLLWLESGSTALRASRYQMAHEFLTEGARRTAADPRPRAFGEDALWAHKRGVALARLGQRGEAEAMLRTSLQGDARNWVRGRSYLELGRLAAGGGQSAVARQHFAQAIRLCEADNDRASAADARRRLEEVQP